MLLKGEFVLVIVIKMLNVGSHSYTSHTRHNHFILKQKQSTQQKTWVIAADIGALKHITFSFGTVAISVIKN